MEKIKLEAIEVINLCKKHMMFTGGCHTQYNKTFELASKGLTQNELAYILYVCSEHPLETINDWITPLFKKGD